MRPDELKLPNNQDNFISKEEIFQGLKAACQADDRAMIKLLLDKNNFSSSEKLKMLVGLIESMKINQKIYLYPLFLIMNSGMDEQDLTQIIAITRNLNIMQMARQLGGKIDDALDFSVRRKRTERWIEAELWELHDFTSSADLNTLKFLLNNCTEEKIKVMDSGLRDSLCQAAVDNDLLLTYFLTEYFIDRKSTDFLYMALNCARTQEALLTAQYLEICFTQRVGESAGEQKNDLNGKIYNRLEEITFSHFELKVTTINLLYKTKKYLENDVSCLHDEIEWNYWKKYEKDILCSMYLALARYCPEEKSKEKKQERIMPRLTAILEFLPLNLFAVRYALKSLQNLSRKVKLNLDGTLRFLSNYYFHYIEATKGIEEWHLHEDFIRAFCREEEDVLRIWNRDREVQKRPVLDHDENPLCADVLRAILAENTLLIWLPKVLSDIVMNYMAVIDLDRIQGLKNFKSFMEAKSPVIASNPHTLCASRRDVVSHPSSQNAAPSPRPSPSSES